MTAADRAVKKYLAKHAEPEVALADALAQSDFAEVLAIPAHGEGPELLRALRSIPESRAGRVLTIVVVNARADSTPEVHAANAASCDALRVHYGAGRELAPGALVFEHERGALVCLERCSDGRFFPARQGVGLARKIGADLGLALVARGGVRSRWIHCTDADALLPSDYFERARESAFEGTSALVQPFRHVHFDDSAGTGAARIGTASRAALEYEIWLRYYVLGLLYAGSSYAFHCIGSTLVLDADAYAQARGFPRRLAAEDFHLLAKLRKLGPVVSLAGAPILLSDRESDRVPFGTGAAIAKAIANLARGEARLCLHPRTFEGLRVWLRVLEQASLEPDRRLEELLEQLAGDIDLSALHAVLEDSGQLEKARTTAARTMQPEHRRRRLHEGFDALASLRLLHELRDRGLPSLPLREALVAAPFTDVAGDAPLEAIRDQLEREELQRATAAR